MADEKIQSKPITTEDPSLGITLHPVTEGEYLASILNYSDKEILPVLAVRESFEITECLYGDPAKIPACDGAIIRLKKR